MEGSVSSQTSPTLLGRLRHQPTDQQAWDSFVARYGPTIFAWCRQQKLPEADAEEVTQNVLILLAEKMRSFAYDPTRSFRGWLRTLTRHAWSDYLTARQRVGRGSGDSEVLDILARVPAREDLVSQLEGHFDLEVLEEAGARVQLRVDKASWDVYQLTTVQGLSVQEAAQKLGKSVGAVYKARQRVHKLLQDEVRKLKGDDS
jgi:RNA polymerase sigma-70 factor (ECF subfamily)